MKIRAVPKTIRHLLALFLLSSLSQIASASSCVVLLHGLAKSDFSMSKIEAHLLSMGHKIVNVDYPSRSDSIENLSTNVGLAVEQCGPAGKVHFVTHSMGGLLLRYYLSNGEQKISTLGRVVMLAPPNRGSEVADFLESVPLFEMIGGPAALQLGTSERGITHQLGEADFELGVIAGNRSINPILSMILPGNDDGKVSVENTKLKGMGDHITLPVSHPFITWNNEAIRQVAFYLNYGHFDRRKRAANGMG